ncbi:hypothetical protein JJB09_26365 [Rhizobium sp. KVB221]|uniref:Uncharacterized protein n=1 Tax=Rhizobium setariae TaxID=2801340 RepID=A0A937CRY2_9HYPH|nr:hypothetical protein [Rhizobium setariae]MBL0375532.1 hypothetical protein [Rhizobium setariae]
MSLTSYRAAPPRVIQRKSGGLVASATFRSLLPVFAEGKIPSEINSLLLLPQQMAALWAALVVFRFVGGLFIVF